MTESSEVILLLDDDTCLGNMKEGFSAAHFCSLFGEKNASLAALRLFSEFTPNDRGMLGVC